MKRNQNEAKKNLNLFFSLLPTNTDIKRYVGASFILISALLPGGMGDNTIKGQRVGFQAGFWDVVWTIFIEYENKRIAWKGAYNNASLPLLITISRGFSPIDDPISFFPLPFMRLVCLNHPTICKLMKEGIY